jgi:hypothetical protein
MLTEDDRRGRYAAQAGADPDTWTGTGPQRRRLRHKTGRAGTAARRAAATRDRAAAAAARGADLDTRARLLLGVRPVTRVAATLAARHRTRTR